MRGLSSFIVSLCLCIPLASCAPPAPPHAMPGAVTVSILDVGQGDAILVRSPEGKTALIDAGQSSSNIVSTLEQQGISTLDLVVVSHHHADHYGGMEKVIRAYHPRVFLASSSSHTSEPYLRLLRLVRDRGIQAIGPLQAPRKIELGTVVLTIFPQAPNDPKEENNNSIGIRVEYGSFSVLLPGDAQTRERRWWERMAPNLCADATVLKLAHHGSRNGTDARWLDLVRPQVAVASMGKDNEYRHPHPEIVELLARSQIPLLRTDRDGTVTIRSDGLHWQVFTHPEVSTGWPIFDQRKSDRSRGDRRSPPKPSSGLININKASKTQLRKIPGVGQVIADRIIKGRPYRTVDDLVRVEGIGEKRLTEIRPYIRAR
ncbi:MBL fold metallo-hydrolase [Singulisphaera acidiphila]|uniref:Putative hydrolase (Metallo-beta-lactamase superfamily) n=1 Tax=Singulisphaera acidiphila (strain ATCC BAA-1392 / DSM 18658 / VKM B-2454 / MOB10) TaxID=886293 RepID=L0DN56_SINAD|nr:MBL fold metallo-hydrolase [Singulisphaera acidiphila]AGA30809.1 putative hydrolase (metallo-beta-lactamase superfamily) [Singulisphaera acidiphila DSM 18658]